MTLLSVPKSTPTTDMFIGDGGVSQRWKESVCAGSEYVEKES